MGSNMPRMAISEITRFKNPFYYSANIQKCIDEFKVDISRLYTAGYSYKEVLSDRKVRQIHALLSRKFSPKEDESRFPFLKRFVDFVYTRDEVHNPFGKWLTFEYMQPLKILEFVQHITKDSDRQRLSYSNLASLVFVLLQYNNITSKDEIIRERRRLQKRMWYQTFSSHDRIIWTILQKEGLIYNRPVIFNKPDDLYAWINVANYRTFKLNCNLLGVSCAFIKRNNKGLKSAVIIGGINKLKARYDHFQNQNDSKYQSIYNQIENQTDSGIKIPSEIQDIVNQYYNNILIRDKKQPSSKHLNDNPFIRLNLYNDKLYCHIQTGFFRFDSLLGSLYFNSNRTRRTIKKPLGELLPPEIKAILQNNSKGFSTEGLKDKLNASGICLRPKCITSPKLDTNGHFQQIEASRFIVKEISANGVCIDIKALNRYRKSIKSKLQETMLEQNGESTDNVTYVELSEDNIDDNPFFLQEKNLSPQDTLKELDKLNGSVWREDPTDNKVGKLYGIFTPHGASTHRMTSHKLNLQGINKEIKKKVMTAREGYCLLSADVSGQDITIAANLAHKLYSKPRMFQTDQSGIFRELKAKIDETLILLSDKSFNVGKPIDFIKDQIIAANSPLLEGMTDLMIRDTIKKAVYTFFYGGGQESFLNSEYPQKWIKEGLLELIDSCYQFEGSVRANLSITDRKRLIRRGNMSGDLDRTIRHVELFLKNFQIRYIWVLNESAKHSEEAGWFLNDVQEELSILYKEYLRLDNVLKKRNSYAYIFSHMKEVIKIGYPGILESFHHYHTYYRENNLTYPSLLGWQTVISLEYGYGKVLTKSKSYPVQAAGAEFIRQWLIELKRSVPDDLQGNGTFKIVNAIHDQVVVEVEMRHKDIASKHILDCARIACLAIGIEPGTLHIPEVKQLYP